MKRRFLMLCISALCGAHAVAQYSLPFLDPDKTVENGRIILFLFLL